jgi:serine/threonine protein kinase
MAAPATSADFLELARKSGVVDEKRLAGHVEKLRAAGSVPDDPAKLAGLMVRDGVLTHFQAEQLLQGKWRRFTLGKYKVLERLGSGGMGTVYLCEHKLMRRRVAVKVLPTGKAGDKSALERFYREARAVAALDHPNIVHAYDIDQDDMLHFLVMEYVDGASLQDIVKKAGPMDPGRAAHYIRQAAEGLDHAHAAGLVHRDIKPGNLLVDRGGTVKVLDLGLARFFHDDEDILTKKYDETVLGTADYLAPEQAVDSHSVDIRADIYSLGATFYYLLTGKTPFGEGSVAQKLIWHQSRQPRPVTTFRTDVPAGLLAVLDRMMAKDPAQRYQTPAAVAEALAPWTLTAIGPPPEAEMPRLSPAATGVTPPSDATVVSSQQAQSTASPTAKTWQVVSPAPRKAPTPPPTRPAPSPAVQPAARPAPAPRATPPAVPRPEINNGVRAVPAAAAPAAAPMSWEEIAATPAQTAPTGDISLDSSKEIPSPARRPARLKKTAAQEDRRRWWVVGGVAGFCILALVILLVMYLRKHGPVPPPERKPLLVSRHGGPTGTFPSIDRALHNAQRDDIIELLDENHEEELVVDGTKVPAGLTVRASPGKAIVWVARKGKEDRPLLHLSRTVGFRLQGEAITLDGQGRQPRLVLLTGVSPGLTIEGLRLDGFTSKGVEISNCAGIKGRPVRLRNLTAAAPKGMNNDKALIYFGANPKMTPPVNSFIEIENCLFLGLPLPDAIRRQDAKVTGEGLVLPKELGW